MEKNRADNCAKESGIALATALIVLTASLLLVAGLSYVLRGSWKVAVLNKKFATAQEAAAGGADHSAEVIRLISNNGTAAALGPMGITSAHETDATDVVFYCDTAKSALVQAISSDRRYTINMTLKCVSTKPIPGSGGALVFPPLPSFGTGGSLPTFYFFYSIISEARDTNSETIGRVEAVYRLAR